MERLITPPPVLTGPRFPPPPSYPPPDFLPHPPSGTQTVEEDDGDVYFHPSSNNFEDIECYQEGGFHPVHLGDTFENGRFRVVHKLGSGGFATVWLARDNYFDIYVSLKIHKAENYGTCNELRFLELFQSEKEFKPGKEFLPVIIHNFTIDGPNGSHLCLVTSVGGPSMKALCRGDRRLSLKKAQKTAKQLAEAVQYLHQLGVCHGDLTGANVLFGLADFDSWTEKQLYERLGQPWIDGVGRWDDKPPAPAAPEYLVEPVNWAAIDSAHLADSIQLIDFGEAFFVNSPPTNKMLGTPLNFLAPEALFELKASESSDDWALACLIFMIRAGEPLLESAGFGTIEESIRQLMEVLGPLPPKWERIFFDEEGMPYVRREENHQKASDPEDHDKKNRPVPRPLIEIVRNIEVPVEFYDVDISPPIGNGEASSTSQPNGAQTLSAQDETGAILDLFKKNVETLLQPRDCSTRDPRTKYRDSDGNIRDLYEKPAPPKKAKISEDEVACLYNLLDSVTRYNPAERISTSQIANHEWLRRDF